MNRVAQLRRLRELLQKRRRSIVETHRASHAELESLKNSDRDPEYEEGAQVELADYTLSHLLEGQRRELMLIDAALKRLDDGGYGECVDCGMQIPFARLEALPFALRCEEDASEREWQARGHALAAMPTM